MNDVLHEYTKKSESIHKLSESGPTGQITVNLGCGVIAGIAASILSHVSCTVV